MDSNGEHRTNEIAFIIQPVRSIQTNEDNHASTHAHMQSSDFYLLIEIFQCRYSMAHTLHVYAVRSYTCRAYICFSSSRSRSVCYHYHCTLSAFGRRCWNRRQSSLSLSHPLPLNNKQVAEVQAISEPVFICVYSWHERTDERTNERAHSQTLTRTFHEFR